MTSLRVTVSASSAQPPYEQIRAQVAGLIAADALREGERLPTVRALAAELGLAVNTVARAYRELEAEGLVATRGRSGTVVAPSSRGDAVAVRRAAEAFAERALLAGLSEEEALDRVREVLRGASG